jgi:hypothetical protein
MFEGYLDRSAEANRKGRDVSGALCFCCFRKDVPDSQCLLADPQRLTVVQAAEHNDWADRVDDTWWREASAFLLAESR